MMFLYGIGATGRSFYSLVPIYTPVTCWTSTNGMLLEIYTNATTHLAWYIMNSSTQYSNDALNNQMGNLCDLIPSKNTCFSLHVGKTHSNIARLRDVSDPWKGRILKLEKTKVSKPCLEFQSGNKVGADER